MDHISYLNSFLSKVPKGQGGGKAQSSTPPENEEATVKSIAEARLVFGLCAGVIEGFPREPEDCIFLDDTPLRDFKGYKLDFRSGTLNQTAIKNFPLASREQDVGNIEVTQDSPVTRTVESSDIDYAVVRLAVNALKKVNREDGSITGNDIDYKIELSEAGGAFKQVFRENLAETLYGSYQWDVKIPLKADSSPWKLRIIRVSKDADDYNINNLYVQAITEVEDTKFIYPKIALLAVGFNAKYFDAIPTIAVLLKGWIIRIPSNYDPVTRKYDGLWDGTYKNGFSNNPVWNTIHLMTDPTDGCGDVIAHSNIEKWSFYDVAKYSDQRVPDGDGGYEPRFTCDLYLENRDNAIAVLESFVSIFRGMAYEAGGGQIYLSCDRVANVIHHYNVTNVIHEYDENGNLKSAPFNYSESDLEARYTVCVVSYRDKEDSYKTKQTYYEDGVGIARYGYKRKDSVGFGATTESQAMRLAVWTIEGQNIQTTLLNIKIGAQGRAERPGNVIAVQDPLIAGYDFGGRIQGFQGGWISLDQSIIFSPNQTYSITIAQGSSGISREFEILETEPSRVRVGSIADPPLVNSAYNIASLDQIQPQLFTVVTTKEETTDEGARIYEVNALEYNKSLTEFVDYGSKISKPKISAVPDLNYKPQPISKFDITERLDATINSGGVKVVLDFSWEHRKGIIDPTYKIRYQYGGFFGITPPKINDPVFVKKVDAIVGTTWRLLDQTDNSNLSWVDVKPGIYKFEITAISPYGKISDSVIVRQYVYGLTIPPKVPDRFYLNLLGDKGTLVWNQAPDLDVRVGGFFAVRFTSLVTGASWSKSTEIARVNGASTSCEIDLKNGTYLIKSVDSMGNYSDQSKSVISNLGAAVKRNEVYTRDLEFVFGAFEKMGKNSEGYLTLGYSNYFQEYEYAIQDYEFDIRTIGQITFDRIPGNFLLGGSEQFDTYGGADIQEVATQGSYVDSEVFDLGQATLCRVSTEVVYDSVDVGTTFLSQSGDFDSIPGTFDGGDLDVVDAWMEIATSMDGVSYSAFQKTLIGDFLARSFKRKIVALTTNQNYNIEIESASITIDMEDRLEAGNFTTNNISSLLITFPRKFYVPPEIGVTMNNLLTGEYIAVTEITSQSFRISVFSPGGTRQARDGAYLAKGYGSF